MRRTTWTRRFYGLAFIVGWLAATASQPAFAQQTSVFGSFGVGLSHTFKGEDPGVPVLGPGVGGTSTTMAVDAGLWLTPRVGVGAEFSWGFPFQVEQHEGGVGLCCSTMTRDHRLAYLSGVGKFRLPGSGLVFLGGLSWGRVSTHEVRVYTPIGGAPRAPVESEFSRSRAAWLVGAEGEIPLSRVLQLVPAARLYVNFPEDELANRSNPLALGNTTLRITMSLRGTSGR